VRHNDVRGRALDFHWWESSISSIEGRSELVLSFSLFLPGALFPFHSS
jgi:hypothetical protein